MKISSLEVSVGCLVLGYLIKDINYMHLGMSIYQVSYIEPMRLNKKKRYFKKNEREKLENKR